MTCSTEVKYKYELTETEQLEFEILLSFAAQIIVSEVENIDVRRDGERIMKTISKFETEIKRGEDSNVSFRRYK